MDLWAVCHALNSRNRPKKNKDMRVISDTYFVVVPQKGTFIINKKYLNGFYCRAFIRSVTERKKIKGLRVDDKGNVGCAKVFDGDKLLMSLMNIQNALDKGVCVWGKQYPEITDFSCFLIGK